MLDPIRCLRQVVSLPRTAIVILKMSLIKSSGSEVTMIPYLKVPLTKMDNLMDFIELLLLMVKWNFLDVSSMDNLLEIVGKV